MSNSETKGVKKPLSTHCNNVLDIKSDDVSKGNAI